MGLPRDMRVNGQTGKYILKRALETILPHDLLYSEKRGFGAPIREWFRGKSGDEFGDRLLNSPIRKRDFFNYKFIERILSEHRSGKGEWSFHLWVLLNVSLWYEHWIDNG
jgi:asparagine synthase (glutamine-hydrolysing)